MNVLTDTWRGMLRRRLWPLALLLVAALAAVPTLLSKQPEPTPVAAVPALAGSDAAAAPVPTTALVSAADDKQPARRRYVLGARKDPFEPAPLPKVKHHKNAAKAKAKAQAAAKPAATPSATPAASTPPTSDAPPPVATQPVAPKPSYPAGSVTVRFGDAGGELTTRLVRRDHALPSAGHPVLVYTGLEDHGKTAVFMVGSDVADLQGDGTCKPDPASCLELRLKAGDTEFVTRQPQSGSTQGVQYELDLQKIHAKR